MTISILDHVDKTEKLQHFWLSSLNFGIVFGRKWRRRHQTSLPGKWALKYIRWSERISTHVKNRAEFRLVLILMLNAIIARDRKIKTYVKCSSCATLQSVLLRNSLIKTGHNKKCKQRNNDTLVTLFYFAALSPFVLHILFNMLF